MKEILKHRTVRITPLYFVIFFGYLGYSLFITVFTPLFLSQESTLFHYSTPLKYRVLLLGITLFLYPFGQFLSSPVLGALSDRFGRRVVLLSSVFISGFSYLLIALSVWLMNVYCLMSCLLLAGLSEGNLTIAQSAIADVSTKKERGKFFGLIYVSTSCSYLVGPLLGGKLANNSFYSFGYQVPFFFVSGLLFSMFLWLYVCFQETLMLHKRNKISVFNAITNIKSAFALRKFRVLFFLNFLIYLSIFGFLQNFPIYLVEKFDLKVGGLSLYIAWTSIPFLIANLWVIGRLSKHFSSLSITIVSAIFVGISMEILLIPLSLNALWFTLFLAGFAVAICLPASSLLVSHAAEENEQGRILGINQSLQFFAEALASLLIGFIAAIYIGLSLMFFGLLAFFGAACLFFYRKKLIFKFFDKKD